ncbi:MAG: uncharacterized protein JWP30_1048 [Homoserinimonas sp.]|nr:uncharacterized protein [Homoserinimonas sp.]
MAATTVAATLILGGCTVQSELVEGTSATVALTHPFTSINPNTSYGSSVPTNGSIFAATNSSFNDYNEVPELVKDASFGSYEVVSENPLTVKYTIAEGVRWSDGIPVDAADMLLAWAANSRVLNDPDAEASQHTDPQTGEFSDDFPEDYVYFDGFTGNGLQLVTSTPVIGDDGTSLTLAYDEYFPDWELVFEVGMPAHVVAGHALDREDSKAAKAALIEAIEGNDRESLAAISRFWNSGFNFQAMPENHDILVSNGPYTVTAIDPEGEVTLTANPYYRGAHSPAIEKIDIRFIADPLQAVHALGEGTIDVVAPQGTADVAESLSALDQVTIQSGLDGAWERLDLQMEQGRNGVFTDPRVREAFLKVVPRQEILQRLVRPVDASAQLRSSHVFMPDTVAYTESVAENGSASFRKVDVSAAEALLAKAGVVSPEVCVLFDPANPRRVTEFQLLRESAAHAGFRVTDCSSPDWNNLLGNPGVYDAALYALQTTNLAVSAVAASFSSSSTINNHNRYANADVDALLASLNHPVDDAGRVRALAEIDALVWADFAGVPLYQYPRILASNRTLEGVERSPLAPTALWNPWRWKPSSGT